jgi:23S rRNA pseudouridine1911/1915/1917 synthase
VIAVDKPAGLASVPVKGSEAPSALAVVSEGLKSKNQRAYVVHRIDRFSSGVLLFAKTGRDREALIRQFLAHTPVREYLAVVRGQIGPKDEPLVHYFRRAGMFQKLSAEGRPEAARAEMRYAIERPLRGATLVRVALVTGLQNQIRAQFAAIGHPVIGDRKYAPAEAEESRIDRVALHAAHLQFAHPRSGKAISIDCPPPADFLALIRALTPRRKNAG